jgi:hypothetical protein
MLQLPRIVGNTWGSELLMDSSTIKEKLELKVWHGMLSLFVGIQSEK